MCWFIASALWLACVLSAQAQPAYAPAGPSARDLVRMVLRASRDIDPERIERLVRRARLSGLSPALRLGAERGLKQDLSSSSTREAERLAAAIADDISLDATLTFDLARLVFAPEEVRLLSVQRWLAGDRRKLVEHALSLYFKRRRLLLEERTAAPEELSGIRLAIEELEALLDAMTDGAYGEALARERANARR